MGVCVVVTEVMGRVGGRFSVVIKVAINIDDWVVFEA